MSCFWHSNLLLSHIFSVSVAFQLRWDSSRRSSNYLLPMQNGRAFVYPKRSFSRNILLSASDSDNGRSADDDEAAPSIDDDDWRAFRARLVLGKQEGDSPTSSSSSSWAYDSGHIIEPGSISKLSLLYIMCLCKSSFIHVYVSAFSLGESGARFLLFWSEPSKLSSFHLITLFIFMFSPSWILNNNKCSLN